MKWTKHAGLVSCNAEARLIIKLDRELKQRKIRNRSRKVKHYAKS